MIWKICAALGAKLFSSVLDKQGTTCLSPHSKFFINIRSVILHNHAPTLMLGRLMKFPVSPGRARVGVGSLPRIWALELLLHKLGPWPLGPDEAQAVA